MNAFIGLCCDTRIYNNDDLIQLHQLHDSGFYSRAGQKRVRASTLWMSANPKLPEKHLTHSVKENA